MIVVIDELNNLDNNMPTSIHVIYISLSLYIYIYISRERDYMCIHMYIYIYIYTYTCRGPRRSRPYLCREIHVPATPQDALRRRETMVGVNMALAEFMQF